MADPTRFGLFALAFETGNLNGLLAKIQAAGYKIVGGPVEMVVGFHGQVRTAVVRGPNQALLEAFEKYAA